MLRRHGRGLSRFGKEAMGDGSAQASIDLDRPEGGAAAQLQVQVWPPQPVLGMCSLRSGLGCWCRGPGSCL